MQTDTPLSKAQVGAASDAWEALLRAYVKLNRKFAQDPVWAQASMREYDIMYTLAKAGCALSQTDLLRSVTLSQPAVSRMLKRMEAKGLVRSSPFHKDARSSQIELTEAGRALQRKMGREHGNQVAAAISGSLNEEEIATLHTLCGKLAGNQENNE